MLYPGEESGEGQKGLREGDKQTMRPPPPLPFPFFALAGAAPMRTPSAAATRAGLFSLSHPVPFPFLSPLPPSLPLFPSLGFPSFPPPLPSSPLGISMMNRNKRRLTKANHGAKPNNSIHRSNKGINGPHGQGWRVKGENARLVRPKVPSIATPKTNAQVAMKATLQAL